MARLLSWQPEIPGWRRTASMGVISKRIDHFRAAIWLHQAQNSRISFPPCSFRLSPRLTTEEKKISPVPYWVNPDLCRTRIRPKVMKIRRLAFCPTSEVAGDTFRDLEIRPVPFLGEFCAPWTCLPYFNVEIEFLDPHTGFHSAGLL
jgi:hypothetical protein